MKKRILNCSVAVLALMSLFVTSCVAGKTDKGKSEEASDTNAVATQRKQKRGTDFKGLKLKEFGYKSDSSKYAEVSIKGVAPIGKDKVSASIRDTLLADLADAAKAQVEGTAYDLPYKGGRTDLKDFANHYGTSVTNCLLGCAKEDYDEYFVGPWTFEYMLDCDTITAKYAFFTANVWCFMGGAHPSGFFNTRMFSLSDGKVVQTLFKPGAENQMQALLLKGLREYLSADSLSDDEVRAEYFLDDGFIPLPYSTPCPTARGLVFTYDQEEIACYAMGRPSFVVPYSALKPFLTSQAKFLLGVK